MGCFMNRVQKYMKLRILLATAKASALAAIASQYAQVGQKNKALEILAEALEIAQSVHI
jgi:hypothetical protein